jgi:hypothetical protein
MGARSREMQQRFGVSPLSFPCMAGMPPPCFLSPPIIRAPDHPRSAIVDSWKIYKNETLKTTLKTNFLKIYATAFKCFDNLANNETFNHGRAGKCTSFFSRE